MAAQAIRIGFRRSHILALLIIFLLGAGLMWYSLVTHPKIRSRVQVLDTQKPMNVLVGVKGTALDPGFLGFVAHVSPNSRVLGVTPLASLTEVTVNNRREPLYQAVSDTSAKKAIKLVSRADGVPIDHYFFINGSDLQLVLDTLYYRSPNWPKTLPPLTMLQTLGYPSGQLEPRQEMKLVGLMVNRLPSLNPIAASSLLGLTRTSHTDFSFYELYLLADYIRGDTLKEVPITHYTHHTRRAHG
ncbi:hypothetical protein [Sulfobacillus harzensis]|uniref:Cell envelope-related transcriptional attenuator domain-containing protein n=1 Tax=Sulfobacillus harzensis TaxID=2729629 RepID=A0A7Y0L345_9FIRM|nr:hypothetical protein [Sulfobacillus harzensis]NMP22315.1 hypothetical protein [Sulfobacillus harzensis]